MRDAPGQFFLVVCHHNQRLLWPQTELLDDLFHEAAVSVVKAMQWLVEYEEVGVFDEGTSQQAEALLAAAEA